MEFRQVKGYRYQGNLFTGPTWDLEKIVLAEYPTF